MRDEDKKPALIFVHGFGSSAKCWDKLLTLLRDDPRVASRYDTYCFEYPTRWFSFNPLRRIPRLSELGDKLRSFVDSDEYRNRELTLIGHSQGGLVIQQYLASVLQAEQGNRLAPIRQVVLLATPNLGSNLLSPARKFFSFLSPNPQERSLRTLEPEIAATRSDILRRVIDATEMSSTTWPVPIHALYGLEDNVVVEASAKGDFQNITAVDGDHFSIICPPSRDHERYKEIVEALTEPTGHKHVFEIDLYETRLVIRPVSGKQQIPPGHPNRKGKIDTDNIATLTRSATFSYKNQCKELFTIRYETKSGGFLQPRISHKNEALSKEIERYNDYGYEFNFCFTPNEPGKQYTLELDIYKGFSEGKRSVHFHLRKDSYFKRLKYTLDLTPYMVSGSGVTRPPKLCFQEVEPPNHDDCQTRGLGRVVEPISIDPSGIWNWELENVRQGVVDFDWDVGKPVALGAV